MEGSVAGLDDVGEAMPEEIWERALDEQLVVQLAQMISCKPKRHSCS